MARKLAVFIAALVLCLGVVGPATAAVAPPAAAMETRTDRPIATPASPLRPQPDRNPVGPRPLPTPAAPGPTLGP